MSSGRPAIGSRISLKQFNTSAWRFQTLTHYLLQLPLSHEHLLLNIFVSFEELSLFSGKEGTQEARRAFPLLRQWAKSRDSRQAVWHAGQIVREATSFPAGLLRDFYAVALYHAGLTLWAYGLLSKDVARALPQNKAYSETLSDKRSSVSLSHHQHQETVCIDRRESPDTQKFIALSRAVPAIHRVSPDLHLHNNHGEQSIEGVERQELVLLDDPKAVMETVISVLQNNHQLTHERLVSPLVENLIHLMRDLSRAAMKFSSR